ncbi:hypothetical protein ILYODFUR_035199 [Ilyodon furcidens]|uniref:Uncharacterized protein n=1 Tax=Ilyodon furcidens TaxID=33524 RepID=A0ABV0U387_9TELE
MSQTVFLKFTLESNHKPRYLYFETTCSSSPEIKNDQRLDQQLKHQHLTYPITSVILPATSSVFNRWYHLHTLAHYIVVSEEIVPSIQPCGTPPEGKETKGKS